jgi:7-cyano-7-deazaguanine synthase in queuosine biosynthesis
MLYESRLDGSQVVVESSHDKRYGILLSGGLDSAVLMYMILKAYPGIDITAFTINKADGAAKYSPAIVEYINQKFKRRIPRPTVINIETEQHRLMNLLAMRDILKNYNIDYVFNAINQNPPELMDLPGAPDRTTERSNQKIYFPFLNLYKTHIIDFMFQFGQEELMNLTHTCTEIPKGRCGHCWQEQERAWAFSQLAKEDTGKL